MVLNELRVRFNVKAPQFTENEVYEKEMVTVMHQYTTWLKLL